MEAGTFLWLPYALAGRLCAPLSDFAEGLAMLPAFGSITMNDLVYVLLFFTCLAAGVGLAVVCDRLMPRGNGNKP
jgi:hypothetical protein